MAPGWEVWPLEGVTRKAANRRGPRLFFLTLLLLGIPIIAEVSLPHRFGAQGARSFQYSGNMSQAPRDMPGADLKRGGGLFIRDCAHCHGKTGDGNSPVRRTLHPAPLDLTRFDLTDSFILQVLHEGVPGSDMPAWHSSPEEDLRAVSAYTAGLGHADHLRDEDRFAPPEALQEAGKRIYAMHCGRCHGERGNGDGKDAAQYLPSPPSFQGVAPSYSIAKQVIEDGVPGTAMASWPLLTPPEIQAVTFYIRSLYAGGRGKPSGTIGAMARVTQ